MERVFVRIVKEVGVYAHGRVQIPSQSLREHNIRDGDRVNWLEYPPGTLVIRPGMLVLEKVASNYRPFTP